MEVFVRLPFFIHNMGDHSMLTNSFTVPLSLFCFLENLDPQCGRIFWILTRKMPMNHGIMRVGQQLSRTCNFFFSLSFSFLSHYFSSPYWIVGAVVQIDWVDYSKLFFFFLVSFPSFPLLFFTILDSERQNFFPCLFPFFPIAFLLHIG